MGTLQCEGLEIGRLDAREVFLVSVGSAPSKVPQPKESAKFGRKTSAKWPDFIAAVAIWMVRENDDAESIAAIASDVLLERLQDIAADWSLEFDRSIFQPGVQKLLSRMREEAFK